MLTVGALMTKVVVTATLDTPLQKVREIMKDQQIRHLPVVDEGELIGFIGPNGAGKTTTLKVLSGRLYPNGGDVTVLGHNPYKREPVLQKQFSLVMGAKNQLWWDLPPLETFILNKEIYEVPDDQYKKNLDELVEMLDVKDILKVQVRKLSLGQRMKCELISALSTALKFFFSMSQPLGWTWLCKKRCAILLKRITKNINQLLY